ncbi:M36 family metallopeptidase [uncultured Fibrella sp.]|uniref:M36 family metallopeptidase n=1 Tax=uncultured Fibrella sp. TaxID=1284596 RepID=UPI0035C9837D
MSHVHASLLQITGSRVALFALFFFVSAQMYAQNAIETAKQYLLKNTDKQKLTQSDVSEASISSAYLSPTTGWYHVYFNQTYQSVDVYNRLMNVVMKDGQVTYVTHNFIPDLASTKSISLVKSVLTPVDALQKAAVHLALPSVTPSRVQELSATRLANGIIAKSNYLVPELSNETVDVQLYWLPVEQTNEGPKIDQRLVLVWNVRFLTKDSRNGWNVHVDALSGTVVRKADDVIHCEFGTHDQLSSAHRCQDKTEHLGLLQARSRFDANSYTVFDYPLESPSHGTRSTVVNPYNRFATGAGPGATNGWHYDGTTTYTTTRGNNVWAQEDANNNDGVGASPVSPTLEFSYPYTFGLNTATGNQNAAITNLFYWNNLIHDVLWKFGFDEPSGNFQNNNQNRGGLGNDYVFADAQDGGGSNNANFYTPTDGNSGRMQMYLWNGPSTYQPDGDFDNGIIAHEYGHGWSTRLTGGPANSSCLYNAEQGGEGWSDYLSLMLTTNWSSLSANVASANIPRGIGTYALGQSTSGVGIRPYRYSYDMTNVNGAVTYAKVGDYNFSQPHGIGSIWATMLWDMTWEIIMQDNQIVANIHNTPAAITDFRGNLAALKLVNEGLRLQACSPSFVQARDAILQADQLLFGGRYRCAIGRAFARRGLGANASTGTSSDDRVVVEDFTPLGGNVLSSALVAASCSGNGFSYTATSATANVAFSWSRAAVAGISNSAASGNSATINETLINTSGAPVSVVYVFTLNPDGCGGVPSPQPVRVTVSPPVNPPLVESYSVCQNATVPPGGGLVSSLSTTSAVSGTLTGSSPTFVRSTSGPVYSAGPTVYYSTYSFVATAGGSQTFRTTGATFDTYLSLYQTSFNAASPATNHLYSDDDSGGGFMSSITYTLTQGTTYILIVGTFSSGSIGTFGLQATTSGFGNVANWYATPNSGTPLAVANVFNPVGIAGSGIPNTATPGTTTFYVASSDAPACRRAVTFTISAQPPAPIATGAIVVYGNPVSLSASGCSGPNTALSWYQAADNALITMPVSVTLTARYYARCTGSVGTNGCLSLKSDDVMVWVSPPAAYESITSGIWNTPSTWNCNCVPDGSLPVRIMNGHTVIMPTAYVGQAKGIRFVGTGKLSAQGTGRVKLSQ